MNANGLTELTGPGLFAQLFAIAYEQAERHILNEQREAAAGREPTEAPPAYESREGTNMWIDTAYYPDRRLRITPENNYDGCPDDTIKNIPRTWPPCLYQYIDGMQYLFIRDLYNGETVAVFGRDRARDIIRRDPWAWEIAGIKANFEYEQWET